MCVCHTVCRRGEGRGGEEERKEQRKGMENKRQGRDRNEGGGEGKEVKK